MSFRLLIKTVIIWWKSLSSRSQETQSSLDSEQTNQSSTLSSKPSRSYIDMAETHKKKYGHLPKFAFVVGHEAVSPGASSVAPLKMSEYSFNKQVSQLCYVFARDLGFDARVFFRDRIGISGAAKLVNEWAPDCCIELHFNSATPAAYGTVCLYDLDPKESKDFAEFVQRRVCEVFKRTGKGDRKTKLLEPGDRGHYNLLSYKVPAIIVEPFFGSNSKDCELAWSNVTNYARGLVRSCIDFVDSKLSRE